MALSHRASGLSPPDAEASRISRICGKNKQSDGVAVLWAGASFVRAGCAVHSTICCTRDGKQNSSIKCKVCKGRMGDCMIQTSS